MARSTSVSMEIGGCQGWERLWDPGCQDCECVCCGPVCLRGTALKHREAGSECVMESESCQTIVLQWSQGERGRAGELLGKEG